MLYLASCLICTFSAFGNVFPSMCLLCQGKYVSYYLLEWVSIRIHSYSAVRSPTPGKPDLYCWTRADDFWVTFVTWGWVWASGWGSGLYCGGWWDSTQDEGPQQPIKGDLGEDGYRWWGQSPMLWKSPSLQKTWEARKDMHLSHCYELSAWCE